MYRRLKRLAVWSWALSPYCTEITCNALSLRGLIIKHSKNFTFSSSETSRKDLLSYLATVLQLSERRQSDIHCYVHTYVHITYVQTRIYEHTNTYVHTHMLTYIHTHTYIYIHRYTRTCVYACTRTYIHTYVYTYTRTYIHTYVYPAPWHSSVPSHSIWDLWWTKLLKG